MSKKVLVIGGGSGIGQSVVTGLTKEGFQVVAASRNLSSEDVPEGVEIQQFDVTADGELSIPDQLDGLVYCPGTINLKPFSSIKLKQFREEFEINYFGAVKVLQKALPALRKGGGSVVMFSTVAVQTGMSFHSAIASAKGAVEGLVRSLAAEYAPKVRFNAIAPSLTDTPLAKNLLSDDKKRKSNTERHPLKKIGTPEDISNLVLYLISDRSAWVTGQVFKIDGGMSSIRPL